MDDVADLEPARSTVELGRDGIGRALELDLAPDDVEHAAALEAGRLLLVDEQTGTSTVTLAPAAARMKSMWIGSSLTGWSWASRGRTRILRPSEIELEHELKKRGFW